MAIEISPTDVTNAEEFIATLLAENVPEGRYTQGAALRDLAVKAFAFIFAYLQKENEEVRSLQSLLNVQNVSVSDDPNLDNAVTTATDAILSNWFITRKGGTFSRGIITIEVTSKQDYLISPDDKILLSQALGYFPDVADTTQTIVIPASDVHPVITTESVVEGFAFTLPMIAARSGAEYDVDPTDWIDVGSFSPYVTRIFNADRFSGGGGRETTAALIERSNTAVAVRNLINGRSIDATLSDRFSEIVRLQTIGMGDLEMQRDAKFEFATGVTIHTGGHFDIYLEMPVTQKTFEGQLGGLYARPDGIANVFRDPVTVPDWTVTDVRVGDVIKISSGIPEAPQDFTIKEILSTELRVSQTGPFSVATDEEGTFVDYFIFRPLFGADAQVLPVVGVNTQGSTSSSIQTPGVLLLPAGPHYDILDVAITDPDTSDIFINDADGFIHFSNRVNQTPTTTPASIDDLEYQIRNPEPQTAQSQRVFEELLLDPLYEGKTVRVTYETLTGFDPVDAFVTDRFERILAANVLARAFYPVYLSFLVTYTLKPTATTTVDETALQFGLVDFVNTFPPSDIIDVSDVMAFVRSFDPNIGNVAPVTISYDAIIPDGRQLSYTTTDVVDLDPDKLDAEFAGELEDPLSFGMSDRTVRYLTNPVKVTIEQG